VRAAAIAALVLCACTRQQDPDDPPVARAYDQYLLWSDLRRMIPMSIDPKDSAARAQGIVDNWLREQVVIHKAEENLSEADKDFEVQLRNYRNSLILYAYERALVEQKLDTSVGEDEIQRYYDENRKNFELKDNIVRARWFKVRESDQRTLRKITQWWNSDGVDDRSELDMWLAQRGIEIHPPTPPPGTPDAQQDWMPFSELQRQVPIETDNPTDFLGSTAGKLVLKDSVNTYYVQILEHRLKDSTSPLEMVQGEIRSLILNQRKLQLIDRMHDDLYRDAWNRKDIEAL
jgi:hypothetical protein